MRGGSPGYRGGEVGVVTDPRGKILAAAPETGEALLRAELDLEAARNKWLTARNHLLGARRPELYRAVLGPGGEPV